MKVRRLCIYFFYDAQGIADRYVEYYLQGLHTVCEKIVVISNGELEQESRKRLESCAEEVLTRPNEGFDVWAYKECLEHIGWSELEKWDEVILANYTLMGPVYPFEEMFSRMNQKEDLDFWGITAFGKLDGDPFGYSPYGYLPQHIQSHFIVYRNRFIRSRELREYWAQIPAISSYQESIGLHESVFTKRFEDLGFKWDTYVKTPEDGKLTTYYIMMDPVRAIRQDRCPVFKRRSFFQPQIYYIDESAGEQPWELFRYLKENTDYDTDMILENLIRSCHQDDIVRTLRLTYVLSSDYRTGPQEHHSRTALVMHLYYMDLLEESVHYAGAMPDDADIYITTCNPEFVEAIQKAFSVLKNRVEVRVIENRGRDVSSLLVGAADLQEKYDLICFYHDKKVKQVEPYTIGHSFAYKVEESVLSSKEYVHNLIQIFENNPKIGMLSGTVPNHSVYLNTLAMEWGPNYELAVKLAEELGIDVPISEDHAPVAPLGTVFWYRTSALAPLFRRQWKYTDFPEEPNEIDGTVLHAIERLYPFAVQEAGYLPGRVMPEHLAALEIENLSFYVRGYNLERLKGNLYGNFQTILAQEGARFDPNLVALAQSANLSTQIRLAMKRRLPRGLYKNIVKIKRSVWGPKDVSFEEAEAGDPF